MQKQRINEQESSIQINDKKQPDPLSGPKACIKYFMVANAFALTLTPTSKSLTYDSLDGNIAIEQKNDCDGDPLPYPTISLKYENGVVLNLISKQKEIPVQMDLNLQKNVVEVKFIEIIKELKEENVMLRNKLKNSFPTHIVVYLAVWSCGLGVSIFLLILTYMYKIRIINPYYAICTFLISLTLFSTAVVAIKDWKEYLNG